MTDRSREANESRPGPEPKSVLILGCGNTLFGDDGFGPAAVAYLTEHYSLPDDVAAIDMGISVRNILFDIILSERKPRKIIIVDAVQADKKPGEIFELDVSRIPVQKIDDFSMHQLPTSNMLVELKQLCGVDVKVICVQVEEIPDAVRPGVSETLLRSLPEVCEKILRESRPGQSEPEGPAAAEGHPVR
jgi:coenzyme F420 hydrogenase subunit delta